ncbi:hypothetical protein F8154_02190 [Alkaliphilus pronyensis]|uniref:Uncharacterized protein n=1 Tax=Alkaliphilus pronyensis TaxID=1482732 RepID=A0A6I0F5G4_9FIRM|nr:hypothetical protein [Alkaliphilus pronyensis]KAB3537810.1 hypothetical protein F8154_02190 [Alkaliphilus pronyensis]
MDFKRINICLMVLIFISIIIFRPTITYTYIQSSPAAHIVNPDWQNYISKYDSEAQLDFLRLNKEELIDILGSPYITIQKNSKMIIKDRKEEILIYMPFIRGENKGTTAIYLYINNNSIVDYRVDDCLGIDTSILPNYFR